MGSVIGATRNVRRHFGSRAFGLLRGYSLLSFSVVVVSIASQFGVLLGWSPLWTSPLVAYWSPGGSTAPVVYWAPEGSTAPEVYRAPEGSTAPEVAPRSLAVLHARRV